MRDYILHKIGRCHECKYWREADKFDALHPTEHTQRMRKCTNPALSNYIGDSPADREGQGESYYTVPEFGCFLFQIRIP